MENFDLQPNYHIFTTLIVAFSEHHQIETAEKLFHRAMKTLYIATEEHNADHQKGSNEIQQIGKIIFCD